MLTRQLNNSSVQNLNQAFTIDLGHQDFFKLMDLDNARVPLPTLPVKKKKKYWSVIRLYLSKNE